MGLEPGLELGLVAVAMGESPDRKKYSNEGNSFLKRKPQRPVLAILF
jgi:hypothetical protein